MSAQGGTTNQSMGGTLGGAFLGSLAGAVVGCLAWIGVGYATGYELGVLAVGVGIAVGIGAAMGAKGRAGTAGGVIAALVCIVAIVAARFTLLQIDINRTIAELRDDPQSEIPGPEDTEYWTAFIADQLIEQREQAGQVIEYPEADEYGEDSLASMYPREIWSEARGNWQALSRSERDQFCAAAAQVIISGDEAAYRTVASVIGVLLSNLHPMALIIMGIAAAGAFRVARNSRPIDQADELPIEAASSATPPAGFAAAGPAIVPAAPANRSPAPAAGAPPACPAQGFRPSAIDESQLPAQFRIKPPPADRDAA